MELSKTGLSAVLGRVFSTIGAAGIEDGLRVERECRERAAKVCDGISQIHNCLAQIAELSVQISDAWKSIKDEPEVKKGNCPSGILDPVNGIRRYVEMAAPLFLINKASFLAPYDRNIEDMTELSKITTLKKEVDELEEKIGKTPSLRRKPLYREMKRICSAIVSNSTAIMNGRYSCEGVPMEYTEAVYGYVSEIVGCAKAKIKEIKSIIG